MTLQKALYNASLICTTYYITLNAVFIQRRTRKGRRRSQLTVRIDVHPLTAMSSRSVIVQLGLVHSVVVPLASRTTQTTTGQSPSSAGGKTDRLTPKDLANVSYETHAPP